MIISCLSIKHNHQNEYIKLSKSTATEHLPRFSSRFIQTSLIANAAVSIVSGFRFIMKNVKFANERAGRRDNPNSFTMATGASQPNGGRFACEAPNSLNLMLTSHADTFQHPTWREGNVSRVLFSRGSDDTGNRHTKPPQDQRANNPT